MKILITGGTGFLGRHLNAHLQEKYPTAELLSISSGDSTTFPWPHAPCELTNAERVSAVVRDFSPDVVYHLVGCARISAELKFPNYFEGNFLTTRNLLEAIETIEKPISLFFTSSMHVYGRTLEMVTEESTVHPDSPYSFTKYLSEQAIRQLTQRKKNFRGIIGRLYTCFGPGQSPGFVAVDLCKKLRELPNSPDAILKTGQLGPYRRFLDGRDAVRAFPLILEKTSPSRFEIVNVASLHEMKISDFLQKLIVISGKTPRVESVPDSTNIFQGTKLSLAKLQQYVDLATFRPVEETLKDMWRDVGY